MISRDVRKKFLEYFKKHSHQVVSSSPVIPHQDPSLLFVNAGMNQFKDVFLGKDRRPYKRATTAQKCIRAGGKHNDLENVGHTSRHCTFFEMLGNFSFGDYFKKEAIGFAWDLVQNVLEFPKEKVWVSVYEEDDEAFELWQKHLPPKRIVKLGKKDNFWEMGPTGPCGPCSELLFDRGEKFSDAPSPKEDLTGERYIEFWNLVFMQFNKDEKGLLQELPAKSIDTGAGLERLVSLVMGVDSIFLTDILNGLIREQEKLFHLRYEGPRMPAFRVIADHLRCLSFAIADGAVPSNTDRGYVLRKILRRAVRYAKVHLNQKKPFLSPLIPKLIELMGPDFPELKTSESRIQEILYTEEEGFFKILERGGNLLSEIMEKSQTKISGENAFKLKDTYGLPFEEIVLIAKDANLSVDEKRFEELEKEARERSKQSQKREHEQFEKNLFADFIKVHGPTQFLGYEKHEILDAKIVALVQNNQFVDRLNPEEEGMVILDKTPFYPESGGQIGDQGEILSSHGAFEVLDTFSPIRGYIAHQGKMKEGVLKKQESVQAHINHERRKNIQCHHTATHLLHTALFEIVGSHIKQAGSLVTDHYLRFDFTHHKALSIDELRQVERYVNQKIRSNQLVKQYEKNFHDIENDAKIKKFFEEKYAEKVRVIDIDFSKELCGGTHAERLGEIGCFFIIKESSIAAGIRRIEARAGQAAENFVYEKFDLLSSIASQLKVNEPKIQSQLTQIVEQNKNLEKEVKSFKQKEMDFLSSDLKQKIQKVNDYSLIFAKVDCKGKELRELSEKIQKTSSFLCLFLYSMDAEEFQIILSFSKNLVEKGLSAQQWMQNILPMISGNGGGTPSIAQATGKNAKGFEEIEQWLQNNLKKL